MQQDNYPHWDKEKRSFYEVWYLKFNLPAQNGTAGPALWLRFTTLSSKNGLKKVAETWAIFFEPGVNSSSSGAPRKLAVKNTSTPGAYNTRADGSVQIEDSVFGPDHTSGCVVGRGNRVEWDLKFTPNDFTFWHVPDFLQKAKLTKSIVCKPNVNVAFTGSFTINDKTYKVNQAPGCQGHIWGSSYAHKWAWAHCNMFENASGQLTDTVLESLSARVKLGGVVTSPQMSALFLQYKGTRYELNRMHDAFAIKSDFSLTKWRFAAEKGPMRVVGEISCDVKDLLAITYEDTDGSYLYCNNSELASMDLSVYFKGKLEESLRSRQTTGFETVERAKSPYVEVLL